MSKIEPMAIGGRELLPHEIAYVDTMSKLFAKESGVDIEWINGKNMLLNKDLYFK